MIVLDAAKSNQAHVAAFNLMTLTNNTNANSATTCQASSYGTANAKTSGTNVVNTPATTTSTIVYHPVNQAS